MPTKLILIEGLPSSGKSTSARLVYEILTELGIEAELIVEGDLDHPADYDGVAYFTENEFNEWLPTTEEFKYLFQERVVKQGNGYFLPYVKIKNELGASFPDELLPSLSKHDIYELPLAKNMELITAKWTSFTDNAGSIGKTYIFECAFIQNPLTIGMVKYGAAQEKVIDYVAKLAEIVKDLDSLLIYIDRNDLDLSFHKATQERPKEWLAGFIDYYTNQGYGLAHGCNGLEGTLEVLRARKELELVIFEKLEINKLKLDNSQYDINQAKERLTEILQPYI